MKTSLVTILCFLFFHPWLNAQKLWENYNHVASISFGVVNIPRVPDVPYVLIRYFQNTGPTVTAGIDFSNTNTSSHLLSARYGFLNSIKDTITYIGLDSNDTDKYYGFQGRVQLASLGYSWQRYFGKNLRLQPYAQLGGEFLLQNRGIQTGYYDPSWSSVVFPYEMPRYTMVSLNLRLGVGLRHKLTDRLTLFEQAEAGALLFHSSGSGVVFSPTEIPREFLFNFNVGLSFKLK